MKRLLATIIFIVSCLGFAVCPAVSAGAADWPRAIQGKLDLSAWDFEKQGHVRLDGQWAFYWGNLIAPEAFTAGNPPPVSGYVKTPGAWNGLLVDGKAIPGRGCATYRLVVRLGEGNHRLAIKILDAATSLTVFVNGDSVMAAGTPGCDAESAISGYRPGVVPLKDAGQRLDIVLHVSNFDHWQGGVWETIELGTQSELAEVRSRYIFEDLFLFGGILIIGLYHLVLFLLRTRDRSALYFGLFCLFIASRTILTGERVVLTVWPSMIWAVLNKLVYMGLFLAIPFFALYTLTLFPQETNKRAIHFFALIGVVLTAMTSVTPIRIYSYTMPFFQVLILLIMLYGLYVVTLANARHRNGARIFLVGFVVLLAAGINDILYSRQMVASTYILPFGLLFFMFSQAVLLARRFSSAFSTVEDQGRQIIRANISLRQEIEEHHRTEEALRSSERNYRLLADNVYDTIWTMDFHTRRFEYVSPSVIRLLGYSVEELTQKSLQDIVTPESYAVIETELENLAKEHASRKQLGLLSRNVELEHIRKDGSRIWTDTRVTLAPEPGGQSVRLVGVTRDVTDRKQVESALRDSEADYRQLVRQAPAGIWEIDFERSRFISINELMCEITGYSREELLSMSPLELLTWDSRQTHLRRMEALARGDAVPESQEYRIRTKHGDERWVLLNINNHYRDGRVWGATVVAQDITERKRVEEAVREWERKYRTVIENVTNGVVVVQDGKVVFANPLMFKATGYSEDELYNLDIWNLIHPDDKDVTLNRHLGILNGEMWPDANEFRFFQKDGTYSWIRGRAVLIEWESRPAVLTINEDITEQKRAIHEKEQLQAQLRQTKKKEPA